MDKGYTTFVLGAGASYPYWFPLGDGLKKILSKVSSQHPKRAPGDPLRAFTLAQILSNAGFNEASIRRFQKDVDGSPQDSIDRFLELRPEYRGIGTFAIAAAISYFQATSNFNKRRDGSGDLYALLYKYIFPDPPTARNGVRIITFNYDCSLELRFQHFLRCDKGLTESESAKIVGDLQIIHMHGQIGGTKPHWPMRTDELQNAADAIRLLYDKRDRKDNEHEGAIWSTIDWSKRIIFLGFGFHNNNLKLLDIRNDWPPESWGAFNKHPTNHNGRPNNKVVYGSCYKIEPDDVEEIQRNFAVTCKIRSTDNTLDCFEYLKRSRLLRS